MRRVEGLLRGALVGALATATMDAAGVVGRKLGAVPSREIGIGQLGRWIGYMRQGRFSHADLAGEPALPHERELGLVVHYAIGTGLTAGYLALLRLRHTEPR